MLLNLQKHRINRLLRQQSNRAMTMIELLVVITIIMVLTAVMIPTIRYQTRNRALHEAERQLTAYIGSAQARAQQMGRPVGIWIERFRNEAIPPIAGANVTLNSALPADANYAVTVYIAEIPLPYSGDVRDARVRLTTTASNWVVNFPFTSVLQNPLNPLIRPGDHFQIQLDHRGPFFEARRTVATSTAVYVLTENPVGDGTRIPLAATTPAGVPFQIHRRPTKSFVPPLNLPVGSVIDLSVSGLTAGGNEFLTNVANGNRPVIVMFQPSGGIESVVFNGKIDRPLGWVHLLVGRQNQVFPSAQFIQADTEVGNVMDMGNRWVSIDHRTGTIVSENVASIAANTLSVFDKIASARQLVRSGTGSEGN